ncbi:hypothetical protein [Streptomyces albidoflavus]
MTPQGRPLFGNPGGAPVRLALLNGDDPRGELRRAVPAGPPVA